MGFAGLFLELVLIRYLAGTIWNLGYFPNLVLLAVFVGMGLGFLFHPLFSEARSRLSFQAAFFVLLGLVSLVYFARPSVPGFDHAQADFGGDFYFTDTTTDTGSGDSFLFIACFVLIILIFALISQRTAKLFRLFAPLRAYTLDIAGSCTGIVAFMLASYLELAPWIWFLVFTGIFVASLAGSWKTRWIPVLPGVALALLAWQQDRSLAGLPDFPDEPEVHWSPYQKLDYIDSPDTPHWIFANQIGHQRMLRPGELERSFYDRPYADRAEVQKLPAYRSVLILGSGSGNDVAAALAFGAERVDAVEIDPAIARLGRAHHPLGPYQDSRVELTVDDGRAFMTRTQRRYDLIVFALTDSVVKVSPVAQLRLENYLFTRESVERAYELLAPGGDIVFYNYYRQAWLYEKIGDMIVAATGKKPRELFRERDFLVIKVGTSSQAATGESLATDLPEDDWPFLYLKGRGIPGLYAKAIGGMCLLVFFLVVLMQRLSGRSRAEGADLFVKLAFLGMGIAFLLLETKSIIQFSLLFGTTWLNNSLVFLAVLLLVLAANWTANLFAPGAKPRWIFVLLIGSSLLTLIFPLRDLLGLDSAVLRFLVASLMTFSPIFFANLVFSMAFRHQKSAEHLFGWNLIGATIGGVVEYTSMALGYNLLAAVVAGCYVLVFVMLMLSQRRSAQTGA